MIRATAAIATVLLIMLLTSGCSGKGQTQPQSSDGSSGQTTTGRGSQTPKPLTRSQAIAFVHAVNLRAADLPGFKVSEPASHSGPRESRLEKEMLVCLGGAASKKEQLAEGDSKGFQRSGAGGDFNISSSVTVARTPTIAAGGLSAIRSDRTRACVKRYVTKLFEHKHPDGASIGDLTVSSEAAAAPGTAGGFVLRIGANITALGKSLPITLELYGFVCGQAEISLTATSIPGPFPASPRQHLLQLLLERAKVQGQCVAVSAPGSGALPQ